MRMQDMKSSRRLDYGHTPEHPLGRHVRQVGMIVGWVWRSLEARVLWEHGAAGSNPVTRTNGRPPPQMATRFMAARYAGNS